MKIERDLLEWERQMLRIHRKLRQLAWRREQGGILAESSLGLPMLAEEELRSMAKEKA